MLCRWLMVAYTRDGSPYFTKERISFERDAFAFNAPVTPAEFLATFREYYGPP